VWQFYSLRNFSKEVFSFWGVVVRFRVRVIGGYGYLLYGGTSCTSPVCPPKDSGWILVGKIRTGVRGRALRGLTRKFEFF
jgi:hypothetical protein